MADAQVFNVFSLCFLQVCRLIFSNWYYPGSMVNISLAEDANASFLGSYHGNSQWAIKDTAIFRKDVDFGCCPDQPYPQVQFVVGVLIHVVSLF
jgi:hypothetical protein